MARGRVSWTGNSSLQHNRQTHCKLTNTHTHTQSVNNLITGLRSATHYLSAALQTLKDQGSKNLPAFQICPLLQNKQLYTYTGHCVLCQTKMDLLSHLTVTCFEGCSKLYLNSLAFQWQGMTFTLCWSLGLFSSEGGAGEVPRIEHMKFVKIVMLVSTVLYWRNKNSLHFILYIKKFPPD